jgi:peptide/nickel transport system substrate-binding protein
MKGSRVSFRPGRIAAAATLLVLLVGMMWGASSALASSSSPSSVSTDGGTVLRVGWASEPNTLNPFRQNLLCEFEVTHLNYDYLVGVDAATYEPKPELATSWSHSDDGLTWTFKTREGVTWQDGVPFTANDVAFTFNYIIKNDIAAYAGPFTGGIKNVTATDDNTAVFHLKKPWALMLRMYIPILPEHIWSKVSPTAATTTFQNSNPVGTGPFQTVSFKTGQIVEMKANKDYWGGAPNVDEVVFQSYQNPNSMGDELKAGAIDVACGIPMAQFKQLSSTEGIKTVAGLRKGFEELGFNTYNGSASLGNPVLKDWKFRQALNYAVDKQVILDTGWMGYGTVASSVIQPGYFHGIDYHWQPSASEAYTFDLTKAGDMLTAAGYPLKNGVRLNKQGKPITLRLVARANGPEGQRAGKLIASWFTQLGLKIQYEVMDESALLAKMYNYDGDTFKPDYDMFFWDWVGAGIDPNYILGVFTTVQIGNLNDSCYSNPDYDKLYSEQQTILDETKRCDVIWEMQKVLYEQSPYIPLVYATNLEAYNSTEWTGWVQSPEGKGGVIYNADTIDTYLKVKPVSGTTTSSDSSSSTGLIVIIVVIVAVVIVGLIVVMRRRRTHSVED